MSDNPSADRVWFRMMRLNTRIKSEIAGRLRKFDLSLPQCDVLTTLSEKEGISQQELAQKLYVTKGNISGLVDRLTEAGFVERRTIDGDRRSHALFLTKAGHKMAAEGIEVQKVYVAETFGRLNDQQLQDFERILIATRDYVREAVEQDVSAS